MLIHYTDDINEQIRIGKRIVSDKPSIYTDPTIEVIKRHIAKVNGEGIFSPIDPEEAFYRSIYDYWVYGSDIREEFYYNFFRKSHQEKAEYITFRNRFWYVNHLNEKKDRVLLDDKYALYEKIEPAFKRKMIKITSEDDWPAFIAFLKEHPCFVIKPIDLGSSLGVRKYDASNCSEEEIKDLFLLLLAEAKDNKKNERWGRGRPSMVLEELIVQDARMAQFHPASIQVIRIPTINDGSGNISIFRPWTKIGAHDSFTAAAATDGCCAEIDKETGIIISDGYSEDCHVYKKHPDTGIVFNGFVIPEWDKALQMCVEFSKMFPTIKYIGWDVALFKDKGWCVVEGNTQADFCVQMITGFGLRKEFEDLIMWRPEKEFWWE